MKKKLLSSSALLLIALLSIRLHFFAAESPAQQSTQPPSSSGGNLRIIDFAQAKKVLHQQIYRDHRKTFYCGADYDQNKRITNYADYRVTNKSNPRAQRIEWEHLVPAENFGRSFPEWRDGHPQCKDSRGRSFKGRRCANKMNSEFQRMEADLYNLVPAIGELNQRRSNFSFAAFQSPRAPSSQLGCQFLVYQRKVQPPPETWGDIARTYLYMDWAYPGHQIISEKNRKLFMAWHHSDPPDQWECERASRITQIQGNSNPFIQCQAADAGKPSAPATQVPNPDGSSQQP